MERAPAAHAGRSPTPGIGPGSMIGDKYRVERELGRGGFGVVVRARHLVLDQVVAIKVLTASDGSEAEQREDAARFRREARATVALRSEHVVRILDVDVLETGSPYIVMEYLEGETLHHVLHTRSPLPVVEAVDHVIEVLSALAEAHAAGIVHRDLKPANVILTRGPSGAPLVKVLDFGVSKIAPHGGLGLATSSQALTRTGALIGTVAYMAPEQMADAKRVDARADLWSVGVILYELLTKATPFGSQNAANQVTAVLTKVPTSLTVARPDTPKELEAIVLKCLQKSPDQRYPTASALGAALAPLASPRSRAALEALRRTGGPTGAAAPLTKAEAPKADRAHGVALGFALAGVFVTVALLAFVVALAVRSRLASPTVRPSASAVRP
jgi:serine/threonine-protein kinase